MSRSFLATIRSAVMSAPEINPSDDEDQPGANAPNANAQDGQSQETAMVDTPSQPGASAGTITQANHDAAVSAARADGEAAGAAASNARFAAVISAEGVAGNATRMGAAIDLAIKSPGMSATDVAGFVTANVSAASVAPAAPAAPAAALANREKDVDPLAGSDQPNATNVKAGWANAFGKTNAR